MIDFTKNIKLTNNLQKKYTYARIFLHVFFIVTVCFVAFKILFPTIILDFSLKNSKSIKNAELFPKMEQGQQFPVSGKISANQAFLFNASPFGQFANAKITLTLKDASTKIQDAKIEITKSFQSFQKNDGTPIGFKNGTLLTTPEDGNYFIVSDEKIRKFANTDIILQFGYPKNAFLEITDADLKYNEPGSEIATAKYPNNSFFLIDDVYYELRDGKLLPFVSQQAFLTKFNTINAITKNKDFFNEFPVSENYLGFNDATLASFDNAVYAISNGKSYPIMNSEAFVFMGYSWQDVLPINQVELGLYEKQKQYTPFQPHPDGTVFFDKNLGKYWAIENNLKRPIPNETIAKNYTKNQPILVDSEGTTKSAACFLSGKILNKKTFECEVSIKDLGELLGNNFQFKTSFANNIELDNIEITFFTPVSFDNMKYSLSQIRNKISTKWQ